MWEWAIGIVILIVIIIAIVYFFQQGPPQPIRPVPPTDIKIDVRNNNASITWNRVPSATSYKLYITDNKGKTTIQQPLTNSADISLQPCVDYSVSVATMQGTVESEKSAPVTIPAYRDKGPVIASTLRRQEILNIRMQRPTRGEYKIIAGPSPDNLPLAAQKLDDVEYRANVSSIPMSQPIYIRATEIIRGCESLPTEYVYRGTL